MKRRVVTITDHAKHRAHWRDLVKEAHTAVETQTPAAREQLAAKALKARTMWEIPAPYPRGLIAGPLWSLSLAYGRQTDATRRDQLAPVLLAVAGMMDELLAEVGAKTPVVATPPVAIVGEATVPRMPYADG
nr:hypothetical protein [uncultured Brevundimonas sp.]